MRSNYKKLGKYIQQVSIKNKDLEVDNLLGVSITKQFIPSIANTIGTDMSKYKVVKKGQFTYGAITSRNGDKISIALLEDEEAIVSTSYTVFEVTNQDELLPEYLMMWFRREEFDRYARYMSHGSTREAFGWEEMCDVELPVPSIEKQKEIVKEYHTITDRIKLNEQLNQKLEDTAQSIYKEWFVNFEFPDENGKPYKSNGGKFKYSEKFKKEIPLEWDDSIQLQDLCSIKGGKRLPKNESLSLNKNSHPYIKIADMTNSKFIVLNDKFEFVDKYVQKKISKYTVDKGDLIISIVGATIGIINIIEDSLNQANLTENCVKITGLTRITKEYLYHYFYSDLLRQEIEMRIVGGAQGKLPIYNIESLPLLYSKDYIINSFSNEVLKIDEYIQKKSLENVLLVELQETLLSKMATIEG